MTEILRLVYASRATFAQGTGTKIDAEVARILMQSRRNNPRFGLVGALYYSNGCFFQCVEGPIDAVEGLYARLHNDPRHRNLSMLRREIVPALTFSTWRMKYVPQAAEVQRLLKEHRQTTFDPYRFDDALIDGMLALLQKGPDSPVEVSAAGEPVLVRTRRPWLRPTLIVGGLAAVAAAVVLILN